VQTGQRHPADLRGLEAACLPAYIAGIHAEGGTADPAQIRRTHASLMTVFAALPSIPIEHLDDEPTPQLRWLFHGRAAIARFVLDLLDDTQPLASGRPAPGQPADTRPENLHENNVTCAVTIDVHAPAAIYQGLHAQVLDRTGGQAGGLWSTSHDPPPTGSRSSKSGTPRPATTTTTTPSLHPSPPKPASPSPPGPTPATAEQPSRPPWRSP
jgi:hypothetical protein